VAGVPASAGRGSHRGRQRDKRQPSKGGRSGSTKSGQRTNRESSPEDSLLPDLQEKAGNQAVTELIQRLVGDTTEVADPDATGVENPTPVSDNPLTGLTKGDGFSTPQNSPIRERVKKLQNKLNVKLPAKLGVDGAFGEKTAIALQEFQADLGNTPAVTVDEDTANVLLDRPRKREGPSEGPDPKPNGVDLGPLMFNTALEGTFDEIVEEYGLMLSNQGVALNEFRMDMATPDIKQLGLAEVLLTEGANFVIDRTLGDAETSLQKIAAATAKSALDALPATPDDAKKAMLKAGVTEPFTSAVTSGKTVVAEAVGGSTTAASIGDFVATQHAGQIASHRDAVAAFQKSKGGLRQFTPQDAALLASQPIPGMVDPRLDRATAVLEGVRQAARRAQTKTYREVVAAWTIVNARQGLVEKHGSTRTDVTDTQALQNAKTGAVKGVLEVTIGFNPADPSEEVRVKEMHIDGLSPVVREKLMGAKGGPTLTIGQLGFPIRVQGSEGGGLFSSSTDIAIAAPEDRRDPDKVNRGNTSADAYLAAKGGDGSGAADEMLQSRGIAKVIQEVDAVLVKAVGLQGP
jgi:peptidoglycan hydrolase-like protein with peptidoglycan-binding domain